MKVQIWHFVVVALAGWINREQQLVVEYLMEESRVLRELIGGKRPRFNDDQRRRLAAKAKKRGGSGLRELNTLVTPDTLLRWHRHRIARKYDGSSKRGPGRPGVMKEIRALVVRMATENKGWGYDRIEGALLNLGHRVSDTTIGRILKAHGIEPAPRRRKSGCWSAFLKAHWEHFAAADFFTVEVWTLRGLVRYHVLIVLELSTRLVHVAGICRALSPGTQSPGDGQRVVDLERLDAIRPAGCLQRAPGRDVEILPPRGGSGMSMEHLDRMALVVRPKQPYVDWANSFDDGGPEYDPSDRSARVYLVNDVVNVTDIGRVVRTCWREIFEERFNAWMRDPGVWPRRRSRAMSLDWLDVQVCGLVFDLGRGPIYYESGA